MSNIFAILFISLSFFKLSKNIDTLFSSINIYTFLFIYDTYRRYFQGQFDEWCLFLSFFLIITLTFGRHTWYDNNNNKHKCYQCRSHAVFLTVIFTLTRLSYTHCTQWRKSRNIQTFCVHVYILNTYYYYAA